MPAPRAAASSSCRTISTALIDMSPTAREADYPDAPESPETPDGRGSSRTHGFGKDSPRGGGSKCGRGAGGSLRAGRGLALPQPEALANRRIRDCLPRPVGPADLERLDARALSEAEVETRRVRGSEPLSRLHLLVHPVRPVPERH